MKNFIFWKREDAIKFIETCFLWIGPGFHPDTDMSDYVDENGESLFSMGDANNNATDLMAAKKILGDDIYEIGMDVGRKLGYYPAPDDQKRWYIVGPKGVSNKGPGFGHCDFETEAEAMEWYESKGFGPEYKVVNG